ncbi:hypothetical protein J6G99_02570 [bacterium]|nr:hypothetical protein [bacterium]
MKKFCLFILFILLTCPIVFAEDASWDSFNGDITGGKKQKFVTDEEFEEAVKKIDNKVNKWRNRVQRWRQPKGTNFSQSNETEQISKGQGEKASLPVISLPVRIKMGEEIIPVGHYQVKGEIVDQNPVLSFYQSGELICKINAHETKEDYDQQEILFASWIAEGDNQVKIIYGSLDFNAYAIVDIAN